ncbi:MAG: dihydrolipoyl dehydrogenase [Candidatus Aminicenantes bacterium]|nr:dihydrolipoyl dehydrogenase [Candidatus Aminicenantes bacterium]
MMEKYDLTVIGGGPGGYVAAIKAAQLKKKVLLIEKERLGGTCMNWGCIPTKYLLHQTKIFQELKKNRNIDGPLNELTCNWSRVQGEKSRIVDRLVKGVQFLLEKNGVKIIKGKALLEDGKHVRIQSDGEQTLFETDKMILATGSRSSHLPFLKPDGKEVLTSRQALDLETIPKKMLIVGAGAIGLEIGTIFHRLGTEIVILEIMPTTLPGSDEEITSRLERILKTQGLKIYTQMKIEKSRLEKGNVVLEGVNLKDQTPFAFEGETVLLATGRRPNSEDIRESELGFKFQRQGFLRVNTKLETDVPGIYAIGDLIGGKLLAHKASHEGIIAAENASGLQKEMHYNAMPLAVFTEPEFSSVGLTEQELKEKGIKYQAGLFSLQANGRALTMGKSEGMVKILADEKDRVIGGHIISPNASEFITEITLAIEKQLRLQDISSSVHIHPTLSESVMEAAMKAKNEAIHMLNQ